MMFSEDAHKDPQIMDEGNKQLVGGTTCCMTKVAL
jgi:hypothetical protein